MIQRLFTYWVLACICGGFVPHTVAGGPSASECAQNGGPYVCVRFDNLDDAPIENTDFSFAFDGSGNPTVTFILGDDGLGTTYEWRVWSQVSSVNDTPADIVEIKGLNAEDYEVKILQPDDDPGAEDVTTINLDPSNAANYSLIEAGELAGNLSGNLTLQQSSGDSGGSLAFTVGSVGSSSTMTIPVCSNFYVTGSVSGDLVVTEIPNGNGRLQIDGNLTSTGSIDIGEMVGGTGPATVIIDGDADGSSGFNQTKSAG